VSTEPGASVYLQTSLAFVKREPVTTSGAIHADVPAVWLILGVCEISRAKPKSVIFSVLLYRMLSRIGSRIKTAQQQPSLLSQQYHLFVR